MCTPAVHDPLSEKERAEILARPRARRALPMFEGGRAKPAVLQAARAKDAAHVPFLVVWEVTLACDLACRHCGSRAAVARPGELSTDECLDLIRQMAEIGVREVALIGGEAYLREDFIELVRAITAHGMRPTMTTGGRGITAELACAAKEAGLFSVSVSIDGTEAVHDRLRGVKGSYAAAIRALGHLRDAGIHIAVNTQINRLSMPDMPHVFETLVATNATAWQLQLTVAMGRAADEPDVLLQPYDLLELFPELAVLAKRAEDADIFFVPGNNIGYFGPYETALRGKTGRGHCASCGAGSFTIGIEADGTIKGCPSLSTERWAGGNIREASLRDLWERTTPLRYTRDRTVDDLWGYCRTCYYADACRAGCTWTGDVLFGRPGNNPYCHHRALEMQRAGKRERVERIAEAPNRPFDHGEFALIEEAWPEPPPEVS